MRVLNDLFFFRIFMLRIFKNSCWADAAKKRISILLTGLAGLTVFAAAVTPALADTFFPASEINSKLYYLIGGGESVPLPPVQNSVTLQIAPGGDVGMGFSCGLFSPIDTISNSLNDFQSSVENVSETLVSDATSAIISFPMYKLAEAEPKLYNILNNNVVGAYNAFGLNLKSCETMQNEALHGKNPYNDWITISRNNNMLGEMLKSAGKGDLNQAMAKVNQTQGNEGVPWATPGQPLGQNAGGLGQPPIEVIHDTVVAGYNIILGRSVTSLSLPGQSSQNQELLNYFATPQAAAKWVTFVVGEQEVTTCTSSNCPKNSTPGHGLLPFVQEATKTIRQNLSNLVANPSSVNEQSLLAVSAPGQVISPALLQNIRLMNVNAQTNTIATLSQDIATARIVNEALLAIQMLQVGEMVPNIYAVSAARKVISHAHMILQTDIDHIMYSVKIRRALNANVMSDIMQYNASENARAAQIPRLGEKPVLLQHGGVVTTGDDQP